MPRPDFRKLATERLSTPEPIGMRIGMLLGMSEAEFSSSGFSAPADIPFAPVSPAPRTMNTRRKSFAAAVAAVVAEPVPVTSLPFLSASSPFLSATTVVETPTKPVKSTATPATKKAAPKKAVVTKATTSRTKATTAKTMKAANTATKRRTRRPAVVATPVAAHAIPVELPESALLAGLVTPAVTPALPVVSGPSPVGDLAARTTPAVAGVRSGAKTGVTDPAIASRDAVMEAFGDELSRLVELLGAPDGRPEDEHERAKVRKFLQISRIYLDNLAVRMK
jgi:hypothetical protein